MLVSCRTSRMLLEAAERAGVAEAELLAPLGLEAAPLRDPSASVEWSTLTAIMGPARAAPRGG